MFVFFLLGAALCLGLLCAAPFTLDIQAGDRVSLRARYLWFTGNIPKRLRPAPSAAGFWRALRAWAPIFRQPRRIRRCRLNLLFSTGDAAETAMIHGWLCGLFAPLRGLPVQERPHIALRPSFSARRELSLNCDISLAIPAALFLFHLCRLGNINKRRTHV